MSHNIDPEQGMPSFINPSRNLNNEEKEAAYKQSIAEINAVLDGENNMIVKMATINCILKSHIPYAYWIGFYCLNDERLTVGPYQGTLGCIHIEIGKGVCGAVAADKQTKIVKDVHQLVEGEEHITCDPNSHSEIVVPVFDKENKLIAVFDVDSSVKESFDNTDQVYLEQIMKDQFEVDHLERQFKG
ncbi:GAF domain-containing protein [Reichenbachiella versicolor]|uniref:GAF domain-containing protein n=1 Tax=Reichenbachiella versicolor TaxID=1821036 RepID=UPI001C86FAC6|nr:GAF domain-containing protein [Reichenbachiella versicolor]